MKDMVRGLSSYSRDEDFISAKNGKMIHVRIPNDVIELVKDEASSRGVTMAKVIREALYKYLMEDSNVMNQMIASVNMLAEQISVLRSEHVFTTKMTESLAYSFFSVSAATGKDAEWEFAESDDGKAALDDKTRYQAEAVKAEADRLFLMWKNKILNSPDLKPTLVEMVVKSLNVTKKAAS